MIKLQCGLNTAILILKLQEKKLYFTNFIFLSSKVYINYIFMYLHLHIMHGNMIQRFFMRQAQCNNIVLYF